MRTDFDNFKRVKDAYKAFIHALVWESKRIDCGAEEEEVNDHIERFCKLYGDFNIDDAHRSVEHFIATRACRYEVFMHLCDENGKIMDDFSKSFESNDIRVVLEKGATFYRNHPHCIVNIFDNETNKYIAEWD